MIEADARVVAVEGDSAEVTTLRQSACGACAAKGGCGTSLLASWFPQRQLRFRVYNGIAARPNDRVVLGLDESMLQRASLLLYGLPLLGLLAGAVLGERAGVQLGAGAELGGVVGGLSGLITTLVWIRHLAGGRVRREGSNAVRLLRIVTQPHSPAQGVPLPVKGDFDNR